VKPISVRSEQEMEIGADRHRAGGADTSKSTRRLERLAWLLDSSIPLPGTSCRVGLDGLSGLVPGIGDLAAGGLSGYILLQALQQGVSWAVALRMLLNILLESTVGIVPVVGDIFDFAYKANERNVRLLLEYQKSPGPVQRRSALLIAVVALLFFAILGLAVWLVILLLKALLSLAF